MFNIALAVAIVLSSLTSFGSASLELFISAEVQRTLPSFLRLTINAAVNYWLVTIFIYLILRGLKAERLLSPTKGIYRVLLSINTIIIIYIFLGIFASTVQGGGASFALISTVGFVVYFLIKSLYIVLLWLLVRSVWLKYNKVELPETKYTPIHKSRSGILAVILIFPPIILLSFTYIGNREKIVLAKQENNAFQQRYEQLCKTVKAEVFKRVDTPKSVYFNPASQYKTLLRELEYVEYLNKWGVMRLTLKKDAKKKKWIEYKDYTRAQKKEWTSRYHVIESWPTQADDKGLGLSFKVTKIIDSQRNEVLAKYSEVTQTQGVKPVKPCPEGYYSRNKNIQKYVFNITEEIPPSVTVKITQ